MKLAQIESIIGNGKFATVDYVTIKGNARTINGRTGVSIGVIGKPRYNAREKGLITVWECRSRSFKTLKPENIKAIRANSEKIDINR